MAIIRYPGGKKKIASDMARCVSAFFKRHDTYEFREPFFGSGSIGLECIKSPFVRKVWFNDFDDALAGMWNAVIHEPDRLCSLIDGFTPSVDAYNEFKSFLKGYKASGDDYVEAGFKKMALHQMSYSGLGTKSGGPIGGKEQKSEYDVGCRWSPDNLKVQIRRIQTRLKQKEVRGSHVSSLDFEYLITDPAPCFIYLDPPYWDKGDELYEHPFTEADHRRLAKALKKTGHPWVLSYDDVKPVRKLYKGCSFKEINFPYTINGVRNKGEILITPEKYAYILNETKEIDIFAG